jgi:hypothetical protein
MLGPVVGQYALVVPERAAYEDSVGHHSSLHRSSYVTKLRGEVAIYFAQRGLVPPANGYGGGGRMAVSPISW